MPEAEEPINNPLPLLRYGAATVLRKMTVFILLSLLMMNIAFALPNPAAVYCKSLGYNYNLIKTPQGERGECKFTAAEKCDEWDFLAGKCGNTYSYCVKNGYDIKTVSDGKNPYSSEYAVCVPKTPGQKEKAVSEFITIPNDIAKPQGDVSGTTTSATQTATSTSSVSGTPPSYFDWRNVSGSNWMTPVKNQGQCGSCWDFAAVGTVEAKIKIENNSPTINLDLSEQDVLSCSGAGRCDGGYSDLALDYIKNTGVVDEACFLYTATDQPCSNKCSGWQSRTFKIGSWNHVPYGGSEKDYLLNRGPLVAYLAISTGSFDSYGIYRCSGNPTPDHAVVLVGYNDTGGYWIIKNSWGSTWNGDGYFKLYYGSCSIQAKAYVYAYGDTTPPNNVTDLSAANFSATTVTLQWTSVSDRGGTQAMDHYMIRYSTSPDINETNFDSLPGIRVNAAAPGVIQTTRVDSLQPQTTYYFAVKAYDSFGRPSNVSNIASAATTEGIVLFTDDVESGNMGWSVNGTDGKGGSALWHITEHSSTSPTHSWYYGIEGQWNYDTGFANNGNLTSPLIDVSDYSQVYLLVKYFADTEPPRGDTDEFTFTAYIDNNFGMQPGATYLLNKSTDGNFTTGFYRLPNSTSGILQLIFNFDTKDALNNIYEGIYIDDIRVIAGNHIPVANAGGPYVNNSGLSVTLDASASYDLDGDPLTYNWYINDTYRAGFAYGKIAPYSFATPGTYEVSLTVYDDKGGISLISNTTVTVTLIPTNLTQSATPPSPHYYGTAVTFSATYLDVNNAPIPDASVAFYIDGTPQTASYVGGSYTYMTNNLTVGTHGWYSAASKAGYEPKTGSNQSYSLIIQTKLNQSVVPSPAYAPVQPTFICGYYNMTGSPVSGAIANVTFDSNIYNATYNASTGNYRYLGVMLNAGTHTWYCSASKSGYEPKTGPVQSYSVQIPPVAALKGGPDGYFYIPNVTGLTSLKVDLWYNGTNATTMWGDQSGGTSLYPTITNWPDGKVDTKDIGFIAKGFGSVEGDTAPPKSINWSYMADCIPDRKVDLRDVSRAAKNFGSVGGIYSSDVTNINVKFNNNLNSTPDASGYIQIPSGAVNFTVYNGTAPVMALVTFYNISGVGR